MPPAADLGGDPADASDVGFAVLFGEGEPGAEIAAHDVAVKAGHGARAVLKQEVVQGASDRGLSATGETGEKHDEAAFVELGLIVVNDLGDGLGGVAQACQGQHFPGRIVGNDSLPQLVVEVRVTVGSQRHCHDCGVSNQFRGSERGFEKSDAAQVLRGACAAQSQQQHSLVRSAM